MTEPAVLVVEDDWLIAEDIARRVARLGVRVCGPATSVESALDLIRQDMPAAALLDVSLGQETSFPIADMLIENGVPVVFVTSFPREALPMRYEGCRLVNKPIAGRTLEANVSALLAEGH